MCSIGSTTGAHRLVIRVLVSLALLIVCCVGVSCSFSVDRVILYNTETFPKPTPTMVIR